MTKKRKYNKYITIRLPQVIVDALMVKLNLVTPEEFEFKLVIAISMLYDILLKNPIYNKEDTDRFITAPMDSRYLKRKYGDTYFEHKRYLSNHCIIWSDYYDVGKTTHFYFQHKDFYKQNIDVLLPITGEKLDEVYNTYCFPEGLAISNSNPINTGIDENKKNGIFKEWYDIKILLTRTTRRYFTSRFEKDAEYISKAPKHIKKMGGYFKKNFKVDYRKAAKYITQNLESELNDATSEDEMGRCYNRYYSRIGSIDAIKGGNKNKTLRFNRNKTNNRLDTNLTNLSSDLRPFIIGYDEMSYLDLKNSQPVLFNIWLRNHRKGASESLIAEIDRYYSLTTSGQWYEELMRIYETNDRAECKKRWMEIAYSQNKHYADKKQVFENAYPGIYGIIKDSKKSDHKAFAIGLQKLESKIFIDDISRELVKRGIIPLTLHDGLMVPKDREEETLQVMRSVLKSYLGTEPTITIE
jgi:hypothetical protein